MKAMEGAHYNGVSDHLLQIVIPPWMWYRMDWNKTSRMTRFHSRLRRALGTAGLVKWQIQICMIIGFVYVHV